MIEAIYRVGWRKGDKETHGGWRERGAMTLLIYVDWSTCAPTKGGAGQFGDPKPEGAWQSRGRLRYLYWASGPGASISLRFPTRSPTFLLPRIPP